GCRRAPILVIEDRCTLDEDLAVREDECRHAADRAKLTKLRGLGKRRQRQQFEGYRQSVRRDPDTSDVGRIVPADQYHLCIIAPAIRTCCSRKLMSRQSRLDASGNLGLTTPNNRLSHSDDAYCPDFGYPREGGGTARRARGDPPN